MSLSVQATTFAVPPLPAVRVSVRARKETIEVARDTTVLMRAAILSHRRRLAGLRPALLEAARAAYQTGARLPEIPPQATAARARELAEILAAAEIAGRMRTRRAAEQADPSAGITAGLGTSAFAEAFPRSVPPEKAIAYIRSLPAVERSQWEAFIRKHQGRAFTVAGVEQRAVLESLRDLIAESLRAGLTPEQFNARAQDLLRNFEISGARLRTVWNQTVGNALRDGRYGELEDPEIRAVLGYWLFDAIVDAVVRPNHAALDGGIAPVDWPGWDFYGDPLGLNCRCARISIPRGRAEQMIASGQGFDLTVSVPAAAGPDAGFARL